VLFADSPGEWFQRWAIEPGAADAEGARWLAERASVIVVVVDCDALSGEKRGQARSDTIQLLRRVAVGRCERPVALLWAKADEVVSPAIREAVREAARRVMPDIVEFETSVVPFKRDDKTIEPGHAIARVVDWMIGPRDRGFTLPSPSPHHSDPFFAIGNAI
tara:strand:- start:30527 stop:31012 length:486 start_codon:yes stop_codon:yes gene_type:complete